jgi:hypothetical protein
MQSVLDRNVVMRRKTFHINITDKPQTDHKVVCVVRMECRQLSVTNMAAVRDDRVTCDNFKV